MSRRFFFSCSYFTCHWANSRSGSALPLALALALASTAVVCCGIGGAAGGLPLCHCFRFDSDLTGKLAFNCFSLTNKTDGRAAGRRVETARQTENSAPNRAGRQVRVFSWQVGARLADTQQWNCIEYIFDSTRRDSFLWLWHTASQNQYTSLTPLTMRAGYNN